MLMAASTAPNKQTTVCQGWTGYTHTCTECKVRHLWGKDKEMVLTVSQPISMQTEASSVVTPTLSLICSLPHFQLINSTLQLLLLAK